MTPDFHDPEYGVSLYCGDCLDVLQWVGEVDAVITDPPFSAKTHDGHNRQCQQLAADPEKYKVMRNELHYNAWSPADIERFIPVAASFCSGWIVIFNDHTNMPVLESALQRTGRYVFAPLSYFAPGSRVRLSGDGPSSWTDWIIVARTTAQARWGTLPGGYLQQPGWREREYIGGKPSRLMEALVKDYSRRGQIVCDPYMGSGSTGVACVRTGRRFVGIEIDPQSFEIARARISEAIRYARENPMLPGLEPHAALETTE